MQHMRSHYCRVRMDCMCIILLLRTTSLQMKHNSRRITPPFWFLLENDWKAMICWERLPSCPLLVSARNRFFRFSTNLSQIRVKYRHVFCVRYVRLVCFYPFKCTNIILLNRCTALLNFPYIEDVRNHAIMRVVSNNAINAASITSKATDFCSWLVINESPVPYLMIIPDQLCRPVPYLRLYLASTGLRNWSFFPRRNVDLRLPDVYGIA